MRRNKRKTHGLLILVLFATPIIALTMGQSQKSPMPKEAPAKQRELPVADFDGQEPTDVMARAKRQAKASRYDRFSSTPIQDVPSITGRIWANHWSRGLSALPIGNSDTILIGWVADAKANLSNDKTGIYSEFTVQVEEILKKDPKASLLPGVVSVERFGGAVRFPSGAVQRYETTGQGMPQVGRRYLLFLKNLDQEQSFSIVTGYELGAEVSPLDGAVVEVGSEAYPFDKYQGFDTLAFLQIVKTAIAQ